MKRFILTCKVIAESLLQFTIVLIGISFITFLILHLSPKNPAEIWLIGSDGNAGTISQEAIKIQEHKMGLDRPFLVQYGVWLGRVAHGNLGISYTSSKSVVDELLGHMPPTLLSAIFAMLITVLLAIPLGIICAVYKDRLVDNILRAFSFVGISMPSFLLSLMLLWFVCIHLKLLPIIAEKGFRGILLPILVLAFQSTAKMIRQVRAIVLDQMSQAYVDGAIMRGVSTRQILFSHVLKNSASPILTCISIYVGIFLGGSTVIEGIFSVNGLGRLALSSVARLDYNVLLGFVLWAAVTYLLVNLSVDILSAIVDPRIRYGQKREE